MDSLPGGWSKVDDSAPPAAAGLAGPGEMPGGWSKVDEPGFLASAARTAGGAIAAPIIRTGGLVAATVARAGAETMRAAGIRGPDPTDLQDAIFQGMDQGIEVANRFYEEKPNERLSTPGKVVGGLMAGVAGGLVPVAGVMMSEAGALDMAVDMAKKGNTLSEIAEAGIPRAIIDQAANLIPFAAGGRVGMAAGRAGLGAIGQAATRVAATGALNVPTMAGARAIENLTSPDEYHQDVLPKSGEQLAEEIGQGVLNIHGETVKSRAQEAREKGEAERAAASAGKSVPDQLKEALGIQGPGEPPPPAAGASGITVDEIEPEQVQAAPAPRTEARGLAPPEPDETVTAAPAKSDRQVELERLRQGATSPEAQDILDRQIADEQKKTQAEWDAEEKRGRQEAAAQELRALAAKTDDPDIAGELMARAEKLSPTRQEPAAAPEQPQPVPGEQEPEAAGAPEPGPQLPPDVPEERRSPERLAADAERQRQAAGAAPQEREHTVGSSPFLHALRDNLGGIHPDERQDMGVDEGIGKSVVFLGGKTPDGVPRGRLFNRNGARMDRVVEWLQGNGYLTDQEVEQADHERPGGSHQLARDLINRELANPGSVKPIGELQDAYAAQFREKQRQRMIDQAQALGIETEGRSDEDIEHELFRRENEEHAKRHGFAVEHMEGQDEVYRAAQVDPDAVERAAIQHEHDLPAFYAEIRRINADHANRAPDSAERNGSEPRPGGASGQPEVRRETEGAAAVEATGDTVRDQSGAGRPDAGERNGQQRPEVPAAGADRGGEAAAQAGGNLGAALVEGKRAKYNPDQGDLFGQKPPDDPKAELAAAVKLDAPTNALARASGADLPPGTRLATQVRTTRSRFTAKIPSGPLNTPARLANAFAYLRRSPREHLDVMVLDKDHNPIAMWRGFSGDIASSPVHFDQINRFVAGVDGAAHFYLAHNHPSGHDEFSKADRSMTLDLHHVSQGIGPKFGGLFVLAAKNGKPTFRLVTGEKPTQDAANGAVPPERGKRDLDVLDRTVTRNGTLPDSPIKAVLTSIDAKTVADHYLKDRSGLVLLNSMNEPIGVVPTDDILNPKMRNTGAGERIMRAISRGNASRALARVPDQSAQTQEAVKNLGAMLRTAGGAPLIDAISPEGSFHERGRQFDRSGETFHSPGDSSQGAGPKGWGTVEPHALEQGDKAASARALISDPRGREALQKRLDEQVQGIKGWLDRKGLSWAHADTTYRIDPRPDAVGANVSLHGPGGRPLISMSAKALLMHPNYIQELLLHEHAHILDQNGNLYSQHPDWEVRRGTDGRMHPVGRIAREIFAAVAKDRNLEEHFQYPMDPKYEKANVDPETFQSELFAQAMTARHVVGLKEAMQNEAPQTVRLINDAVAHASQEGTVPTRTGTEPIIKLQRSYAARRSARGVPDPAAGSGGADRLERELQGAGDERGQGHGGLTEEDDRNEAAKIREVLQRNFDNATLQRMVRAAREEDEKLRSGVPDAGKGLDSLPPEQREVMEFLAGRGYEPDVLGKLLGAKYALYGDTTMPKPAAGGGGFGDALRKWIAPASRGPTAQAQAGIMRANLSRVAIEQNRAEHEWMDAAKMFNGLSNAENIAFTDAIERGAPLRDKNQAQVAHALRTMLDDLLKQVQEYGALAKSSLEDNYFPHYWKEKVTAQELNGRRPLAGSQAFRKKRTIPTVVDGMRWRAYDADDAFAGSFDTQEQAEAVAGRLGGRVGKPLTPISTNPVEMALLKAQEMRRFLAAQRIFTEMKDEGIATLVPHGAQKPDGYTFLNDAIANAGTQGKYAAPDEAATLFNNHLSPGLQGNTIYQALRGASTALQTAQLGFSAFHAGFTSMDTMASRVALGVKQMRRGDIVRGIGNVAMGLGPLSPAVPFMTYYKGDRLLRAALGDIDSPEMAPIVAALQDAGGRIRIDQIYKNAVVNSMYQAYRRRDWLGVAKGVLPTLLDKINFPIMEHLVPRQKLGVFFDMARDWLRVNPDADVATRRRELGKLWDSVDNRMGQLVYDNVFWDRSLKDALHLTVRSVGWNLGTLRELGGGVADLPKALTRAGMSDRAAYVIGMPAVAAVYGAMIQYLYTGQGPQELKDYFFPRTGRIRPDGSEDRVSLPMYTKDIAAYYKDAKGFLKYGDDPTQTLRNKANPIIGTISDMMTNRDFFGAVIRNPADPWLKQIEQEAEFLIKQIEPFSLSNFQQQQKLQGPTAEQKSLAQKAIDYVNPVANPAMVGVAPAPGYITKSDEQQESSEVSALREPLIRKFREEIQDLPPGADPSRIVERMRASGLGKQDIQYVMRSARGQQKHRLRAFAHSAQGG